MNQPWMMFALLITPILAGAQTNVAVQSAESYRLSISVGEVSLSFHAVNGHVLPINDLKLNELTMLDNGTPASEILSFQPLQERPIRAGILIDTSDSMEGYLARNRAIAIEYAQLYYGSKPTRRS